ncbi:MAG: hypothetical protein N4A46_12205 [Schleiferiaceae bacterium]|jgi:hypothetical protein|nr:hypothetical protein [Schleiferiaceae bacterium]
MKKIITSIALTAFIVLGFTSCKKQSFNYPFKINVVSEDGTPLQNILVEAGAPVPDAIPEFSGYTNEDGSVSFTYTYEAVLQVVATRGINPPSYIGCGFVKLEEDQTVELTIVMQPYDPSQQGC